MQILISNLFSETASFTADGDVRRSVAGACERRLHYRSFSHGLRCQAIVRPVTARSGISTPDTGNRSQKQPLGVGRGSFARSGIGCGRQIARTGANAHRLIAWKQGYDLSINRYKEVVHEEVDHRPPQAILDELDSIEKEITQGMKQLRGMLN